MRQTSTLIFFLSEKLFYVLLTNTISKQVFSSIYKYNHTTEKIKEKYMSPVRST